MGVIIVNSFRFGSAPLAISLDSEPPPPLELAGSAGASIDSVSGQIDVTAIASGGTAPHAYAWTVTETSDGASCLSVLAAGTQNTARYNTLTIRSVTPSVPQVNGEYRLTCTVTDGVGDTEAVDVTFPVASIPI